MYKVENYIDGKKTSISKRFLDIFDPSTGDVVGNVVLSNKDDFVNLIKSSQKSQITWSEFTPLKRSRILSKYKELIEKIWMNLLSLSLLSMVKP